MARFVLNKLPSLADTNQRASRRQVTAAPALSGIPFFVAALTVFGTAFGQGAAVEVKGFFCDSEASVIEFLKERARGENDILSANAVNKHHGKQVCAEYRPAVALTGEEKTIMDDGLVFTIQSYVFLPEKVTRWSGSYYGSLPSQQQERGI